MGRQPAGPCASRPGWASTRLRLSEGGVRALRGEVPRHPPQPELMGSLSLEVWVAEVHDKVTSFAAGRLLDGRSERWDQLR